MTNFDCTASFDQLQAAAEAAGAAIETTCSGELVIYTGIARDANGNAVTWCEECESGADVPAAGCTFCDRPPLLGVVT